MQMNKEKVLIFRSDLGSSFSLDVGLYLGSDAGLVVGSDVFQSNFLNVLMVARHSLTDLKLSLKKSKEHQLGICLVSDLTSLSSLKVAQTRFSGSPLSSSASSTSASS